MPVAVRAWEERGRLAFAHQRGRSLDPPVPYPGKLARDADAFFAGGNALPEWFKQIEGIRNADEIELQARAWIHDTCLKSVSAGIGQERDLIIAADGRACAVPFELASDGGANGQLWTHGANASIARALSVKPGTRIVTPFDSVPNIALLTGESKNDYWDVECHGEIDDQLGVLHRAGKVQMFSPGEPVRSADEVVSFLEQQPADVIILVAHGNDDGTVELKRGERTTATTLADALAASSPSIVILAVCWAGRPDIESTAVELLRRMVPFVVAPRSEVPARAMKDYVCGFLDELAHPSCASVRNAVRAGLGDVSKNHNPLRSGQILFFTSTSNYTISRARPGHAATPQEQSESHRDGAATMSRRAALAIAGVAVLMLGGLVVAGLAPNGGEQGAAGSVPTASESVQATEVVATTDTVQPTTSEMLEDESSQASETDPRDVDSPPEIDLRDIPASETAPVDEIVTQEATGSDRSTQVPRDQTDVDATDLDDTPTPDNESDDRPSRSLRARQLEAAGDSGAALAVLLAGDTDDADTDEETAVLTARLLDDGTDAGAEAAHNSLVEWIGTSETAASDAVIARSLLYLLRFDPDVARPRLVALADESDDGFVQLAFAHVAFESGDYPVALTTAREAERTLAADGRVDEQQAALEFMARAQWAMHETGNAVESLRAADDVGGLAPDSRLLLAEALVAQGASDDIREATDHVQSLFGNETLVFAARRLHAQILRGDSVPDAIDTIQAAIDREQGAPEREVALNHVALAQTLEAGGQDPTAEYRRAAELAPNRHEPLQAYARYLGAQAGQEAEQLDALRAATALPTAEASTWLERCLAEDDDTVSPDDNLDLAWDACVRASQLDQWDEYTIQWAATIAHQRDDQVTAESLLASALVIDPVDPWSLGTRCRWENADESSTSTEIVDACEAAWAQSKEHSTARILAGEYRKLGHFGDAETTLRDALDAVGSDSTTWGQLAELVDDLPAIDASEVADLYRSAVDAAENQPAVNHLRQLGQTLLDTDPAAAVDVFTDLSQRDELNALDLVDQAAAHVAAGNDGQAAASFAAAVALDPAEALDRGRLREVPDDVLRPAIDAVLASPDATVANLRSALEAATSVDGECDGAKAAQMAREVSQQRPDARRSLFGRAAWCLYSDRELAAVREMARELQADDPAFADYVLGYWYYDGFVDFGIEDPDIPDPAAAAQERLGAAIAAEPDYYSPYHAIIQIHRVRGAEGLAEYKAAWQRAFDEFDIWESGLIDVIQHVRSTEPADQDLPILIERLRDLHDSPQVDRVLGTALFASGAEDDAEPYLRNALAGQAMDLESVEALQELSTSKWEKARLATAAASLRQDDGARRSDAGNRWYDVAADAEAGQSPTSRGEVWERAEEQYRLALDGDEAAVEYATVQLANLYLIGFDRERQQDGLEFVRNLVKDGSSFISNARLFGWAESIASDVIGGPAIVRELVSYLEVGPGEQAGRIELAESVMKRWPRRDGYELALSILDDVGVDD